jgi:hypothetical protein
MDPNPYESPGEPNTAVTEQLPVRRSLWIDLLLFALLVLIVALLNWPVVD